MIIFHSYGLGIITGWCLYGIAEHLHLIRGLL